MHNARADEAPPAAAPRPGAAAAAAPDPMQNAPLAHLAAMAREGAAAAREGLAGPGKLGDLVYRAREKTQEPAQRAALGEGGGEGGGGAERAQGQGQ